MQSEQSGRMTISERDVVSLLKAQGQVSARNSLAFLARRHLPRELSDLITSTTATAPSSRRTRTRKQQQQSHEGEEGEEEEGEEEA